MSAAAPPSSTEPALRPCLSSSSSSPSSDKRRRGRRTVVRRKAEKRVRFAADVVDNEGAPRPVRSSPSMSAAAGPASSCRGAVEERMPLPANREALYRGMLRDRSAHRVTCTY
ncbi:hypothetical protein PR202_ga06831 [Eleusine coracana subsp. coracana]|uniref:Uncharacterized protein n=1 Tax=Eleusine coracana subsp. coracana TaxID=191504 RepID=A0AAV5BX30_ELECO|nr:hypothetical protein PR202_ga06831 [Eleusine coracana subsp. coracana]